MSDDERPTRSKNIWGRISRSASQEEGVTTKSPGFFRKRTDSYGELVSPTPTRKKRWNERKARGYSADASASDHDETEDTQDQPRRRRPFQRRHTATLSGDNSPKKSLFSRVGRKRREKKAMRESGCKSDGDSVDLGASDCSSIADPLVPKRVGFRDTTKPPRERSLDSHPIRRGSSENDDFFEAHSYDPQGHEQPRRQTSFDNLPPAPPQPEAQPPLTIDSMPLYQKSNSFDSAPPATTTADTDYGYGEDSYGGGLARTGQLDSSGVDSARPRAASDFSMPPTNTTRRARGQRAQYNYQVSGGIKKKFRVRPYHCFPDGTQMTEEEIYADSMEVSKQFLDIQSYLAPSTTVTKAMGVSERIRAKWGTPNDDGRIGSLRVEILGCIGLSRTKPDVSAYVICGDGAFCTDVLTGYRSPMWPSVARRACIFPIHHAYAKLYVGVFDCRIRKTKENDFFCGRVSIDIGSLRPNTEYDTTLPLRASTFVYDKRKRGVIRIRMSVHWFDERSAILSYFPPVRSIAESAPLLEGQPTIPCGDPKTFRNVALTIYGQDLPGKYSKTAFKATMREFNLYQQNLNHFLKTFFVNLMLYERPVLSLYCLATNMYCVSFNSVRMVPAFFVGFLIIVLIRSYLSFVEDSSYHLGYKPISIPEVFRALTKKPGQTAQEDSVFEALSVEKRTKQRKAHRFGRMNSRDESESQNPGNEAEAEEEVRLVDHREFPFSDRDAYPKFSVEEALANAGTNSSSAM